MGHEVVIYGVIVAPMYRGHDYDRLRLHVLNDRVVRSLPRDDDWPWVDLSIFALPGPQPIGTYRRQIIHFGLSIKDDPDPAGKWWESWLGKFENVLRRLFWSSVRLHIERDFQPRRQEYTWTPTEQATAALHADPPEPVGGWVRSSQTLAGDKLPGT